MLYSSSLHLFSSGRVCGDYYYYSQRTRSSTTTQSSSESRDASRPITRAKGANPQLIQIISQRTEDLNDRADLLDPQDPCPDFSTNLDFSYPIHNPLFLFFETSNGSLQQIIKLRLDSSPVRHRQSL
jgi:hypothetical protein